jgi:glycosyltransferase involved in cell wall biosynthesis
MGEGVPVSIILPTYDRAALLGRSIDTVLAQTYGDFELIVVDDGSRDGTAGVVSAYADRRVRYVALPENRGLPAARNAGLAQARGDYLAFQDSDDEWLPRKLELQMRALEANPAAGVVYCDMFRIRADGGVFLHRSPTIERGRLLNPETGYWQSYMLAMQPVLMRRACLAQAGAFDESLVAFEDLDFHLRVAQHYDFVHLHEPLVNYHATAGAMTTDRRAELTARRQLVRKYFRALLWRDAWFAAKETVDVLLKRSLLPIVDRHLTPV